LIKVLIGAGAGVEGINSVQTQFAANDGMRHLSCEGKFEAISMLVDGGADPDPLEWTPLMKTAAIGSFADVKTDLTACVDLEEKDWWERTA
jgi:hypothetical protein